MSALVKIKVNAKLQGVGSLIRRGFLPSGEEKPKSMGHDEWENKTKELRVPTNKEGFVTFPSTALKDCVKKGAVKLKRTVPGQGQTKYGSVFTTGFKVLKNLILSANIKDARYETIMVPSDGKPGGGTKVPRYFAHFDKWDCDVEFMVTDSTITEEVFQEALEYAGMNIGLGTWRSERGKSDFGCFTVEKLEWDV